MTSPLAVFRTMAVVALMLAPVFTARVATAQTATQTVTFEVVAINEIQFSGAPSLVVNSAEAGAQPRAVASASWSVTTNQTNAKVAANLGSSMPAGLVLSVELVPPAGASAQGERELTSAAVDLVSGMTRQNAGGLTVTYRLVAAPDVAPGTTGNRTVTYTITGGV